MVHSLVHGRDDLPERGSWPTLFQQLSREEHLVFLERIHNIYFKHFQERLHTSLLYSYSLSLIFSPPFTQGPSGSCSGCKGHCCMWLSQRKHGLVPGCLEGLGRPRARALLPVLWRAWSFGDQHEEKKVAVCECVCLTEQNRSTVWLKVTLGNTHICKGKRTQLWGTGGPAH